MISLIYRQALFDLIVWCVALGLPILGTLFVRLGQ